MSYFAEATKESADDGAVMFPEDTPAVEIQLEVTGYHLRLGGNRAVLELEGGGPGNNSNEQPLARIDFRPGATPLGFVNHGGFISVVRPMSMLAATVDMLRHDAPVFIDTSGTLTTYQRTGDRTLSTF